MIPSILKSESGLPCRLIQHQMNVRRSKLRSVPLAPICSQRLLNWFLIRLRILSGEASRTFPIQTCAHAALSGPSESSGQTAVFAVVEHWWPRSASCANLNRHRSHPSRRSSHVLSPVPTSIVAASWKSCKSGLLAERSRACRSWSAESTRNSSGNVEG